MSLCPAIFQAFSASPVNNFTCNGHLLKGLVTTMVMATLIVIQDRVQLYATEHKLNTILHSRRPSKGGGTIGVAQMSRLVRVLPCPFELKSGLGDVFQRSVDAEDVYPSHQPRRKAVYNHLHHPRSLVPRLSCSLRDFSIMLSVHRKRLKPHDFFSRSLLNVPYPTRRRRSTPNICSAYIT